MLQLEGKHSKVYNELREKLVRMLAHAEAYIDFEADEVSDHVTDAVFAALHGDAALLIAQMDCYLERGQVSEAIREGLQVAIVGPPNAGKSTLMNLMAQRQVSIVSEQPGTTRDLVSTSVVLSGH